MDGHCHVYDLVSPLLRVKYLDKEVTENGKVARFIQPHSLNFYFRCLTTLIILKYSSKN